MLTITKVKFHSLTSIDIAGEAQSILESEYYGTMDKVFLDAEIINVDGSSVLKVKYKE